MFDRILETEMLVQRPAEFEYRDGLVHVVSWLGENVALRLAYPLHLFVGNVRRGQSLIAKWQDEQSRVAVIDLKDFRG